MVPIFQTFELMYIVLPHIITVKYKCSNFLYLLGRGWHNEFKRLILLVVINVKNATGEKPQ